MPQFLIFFGLLSSFSFFSSVLPLCFHLLNSPVFLISSPQLSLLSSYSLHNHLIIPSCTNCQASLFHRVCVCMHSQYVLDLTVQFMFVYVCTRMDVVYLYAWNPLGGLFISVQLSWGWRYCTYCKSWTKFMSGGSIITGHMVPKKNTGGPVD